MDKVLFCDEKTIKTERGAFKDIADVKVDELTIGDIEKKCIEQDIIIKALVKKNNDLCDALELNAKILNVITAYLDGVLTDKTFADLEEKIKDIYKENTK